jgi:hypothetical protein
MKKAILQLPDVRTSCVKETDKATLMADSTENQEVLFNVYKE